MFLHKGRVRSSLIYFYNAVMCLVYQFYTYTLQALLNRSYPSLEWGLSSPPKPHAFVSLPLQSRFFSFINFKGVFINFFKNFLKYVIFILPFILVFKALYTCWLNGVWDFQFFGQQLISNLPFVGKTFFNIIWKEESLLSTDIIRHNQWIMELTFVGGLGASLGRAIVETYFINFTKVPTEGETFMSSSNLNTLNSDSATQSGKSTSSITPSEAVDRFIKDVQEWTGVFVDSNKKSVDELTKINKHNHLFRIDHPNAIEPFWKILNSHSDIVTTHISQRTYWIEQMSMYLDDDARNKLQEKMEKKDALFNDFLVNVEKLGDKEGDIKGKYTQFFNLTNAYRRGCLKEVNSMESIILENIRGGALGKNPDLKRAVHVEYAQAKKAFSVQDEILKKRMSEILNAPKK